MMRENELETDGNLAKILKFSSQTVHTTKVRGSKLYLRRVKNLQN